MEYNYIVSIKTITGAHMEINVKAKNEEGAKEKIQNLPEIVSFYSLPVRDTN